MQTKKMTLATMQGKLSRLEMKNIKGGGNEGSGGGGAGCLSACDGSCSINCNGNSTIGTCGINASSGLCNCVAVC